MLRRVRRGIGCGFYRQPASARACASASCASNKMCRSRRCPVFLLHQSMLIQSEPGAALAVGQVARSSWAMAASLAPGITSAPRPPGPALIHLLATCLWSFSHLDLFASHQPQHPVHLLRYRAACTEMPAHLLISCEQLQPRILLSDTNPSSTASKESINKGETSS